MTRRIRTFALSLLALGALAFGGATLANAGSNTGEKPGQESTAPENSASDGDNVQYTPPGERAAEAKTATKTVAKKKAHRSKASHRSHASQVQSSQAETQGEAPETQGESGSEAPGNDGPGGHADEPGNPNANHQHEGQE